MASRADVQRLVSIEILGAQRRTLRRFAEVSGYPGLLAVLWDPRIEHRVGDGRAYLVHAGRMFDIIEADALRPSSAYAGNLYSQEYFRLLLRRLKPGGLAVTWAPTERIRSTFLAVFPHVVAVQEQIYIGSTAAIPYDPAVIVARARETSDYFYAAGVDIIGLLQPYLASTPLVFGTDARRDTRGLNTDMFPRDEFALPF